jgi:hypothetical protein
MYTVIVHPSYSNEVIEWSTFATMDAAVRCADKFRQEAWVIVSETREFVYTNR